MPIQNVLSPYKVGAVKSSQIQNMLGNEYGYFFTMSYKQTGTNVKNISSTPTITSADSITAEDVVRIERTVLYSEFEIVSEGINIRATGKSNPVSSPPNVFMTNVAYNEAFDYWIYLESVGPTTVTSGWVTINGFDVVYPTDFRSGEVLVVKQIPIVDDKGNLILKNESNLLPNSVVLMIEGSPTDKMNVYIIQVPKGTPESAVNPEGGNRQPCRVEFFVWLR
jgi:hypothetical protein